MDRTTTFSSLSSTPSLALAVPILCGRGDKRTKKGKRFKGSYGNSRPKKEKKIERIKDKVEDPSSSFLHGRNLKVLDGPSIMMEVGLSTQDQWVPDCAFVNVDLNSRYQVVRNFRVIFQGNGEETFGNKVILLRRLSVEFTAVDLALRRLVVDKSVGVSYTRGALCGGWEVSRVEVSVAAGRSEGEVPEKEGGSGGFLPFSTSPGGASVIPKWGDIFVMPAQDQWVPDCAFVNVDLNSRYQVVRDFRVTLQGNGEETFGNKVVYGCVFSGYLDVWMAFSATYGCFIVRVGEVENELVANVEAFFALNKAVMFQRVFMANRLIIGQWGYVRKTDFPCILKLLGVEDDGQLVCVLRSLANGVLMFVFGLQSSYKVCLGHEPIYSLKEWQGYSPPLIRWTRIPLVSQRWLSAFGLRAKKWGHGWDVKRASFGNFAGDEFCSPK
ncbi:hypothetical protein LOK49_LG02G03763 [Camellia lanceoleosa]|uniref:Uncharacterized protein n=1 Tax=Camellia lanceoleosa TaxID=1840588 RepID=A0ACC0INF9_9ERIC|nr:hypothetical protein LOK49_LG02G03763 [Camellia lanceoleosa]